MKNKKAGGRPIITASQCYTGTGKVDSKIDDNVKTLLVEGHSYVSKETIEKYSPQLLEAMNERSCPACDAKHKPTNPAKGGLIKKWHEFYMKNGLGGYQEELNPADAQIKFFNLSVNCCNTEGMMAKCTRKKDQKCMHEMEGRVTGKCIHHRPDDICTNQEAF